MREAISNDLNTSSMLTLVYDVLKDDELSDFTKLYLIDDFDKVLSLKLIEEEQDITPDLEDMINLRIRERNEAKLNKDYELADQIRDELLKKGVRLIDTKEGTKFELI